MCINRPSRWILHPKLLLFHYCHHQRPTTPLRYTEPVVRTLADKPHDAAGGVGENELAALAEDGIFPVGEIVAHKFCPLHAERNETVAFGGGTQRERKCYLIGVKTHRIGRTGQDKAVVYRLYADFCLLYTSDAADE